MRAPAKPQASPPAAVTMRRALSDPALLGNVLAGESWLAWRVLLIALMGEALGDDERAIFAKLTGRAAEPLERIDEVWAVVGRRGGKSRATAVLIVFIAVFVDHSEVLVTGERPVALCLAPSQKQAGVVFGYVAGILESVPILAKLVKSKTNEIIALTNGIEIEIRSASFRNVRGVTAVAVVGDEAAFWYTEDSASGNPDTAILDAVRPALATTGGLLAVISSPYARRGAVFDTWSRHYGEKGDPRILVAQGASRDFNPSLPQKVVDRAMERDPAAASAEYLGLFRSDLEAFVSREAVEACIDRGVFERAPSASAQYVGFVDPSGGSQDSFTAAIAHRQDGAIVLDAVREVKPPFSPENVTRELASFFLSYRVKQVRGDKYAGEWPREQFRKFSVEYEPAAKPKSEIYAALLPIINSRRAALLDNPRIVSQLTALERRVSRGGGRDSIDHPPSGHDDLVNAVAGVITMLAVDDEPGMFAYYRWLMGSEDDRPRPSENALVALRVPHGSGGARGLSGRNYTPDDNGVIHVDPIDVNPLLGAGFTKL